jgi:soluble lytic murein transglycosylase
MGTQPETPSRGGKRFGWFLGLAVVVGGLSGLAIGTFPGGEEADSPETAVLPAASPAATEPATKQASAPVEELTPKPAPRSDVDIRPLPKVPPEVGTPSSQAGRSGQETDAARDGVPAIPAKKFPPPQHEPRIAALAPPTNKSAAKPWSHAERKPDRGLGKVAIADRLNQVERIRLSEQDLKLLKEAVRLFYKDSFDAGKQLIARIENKTARVMAQWYYLRSSKGHASLADFVTFRRDHPLWPSQDLLRANAELSAFLREPARADIIRFFEDTPPQTGAGKAALGAALLAGGETERGTALIRAAWRKHSLSEDAQQAIRKRFGKLLRKEDHKARADWLLMQDRRTLSDDARRLKTELDKDDQASLSARVAEVRRSRRAGTLLTRLDKDLKTRPEVLLSRVRWLRRHGNDEKAWRLLGLAPKDAEALIDPSEWWSERRIQTRTALNAGHPKTAYRIARDHGGATGENFHEAEFLAGWIALRWLDKPAEARKHFTASRDGADLPADFARSGYWTGRAELALGNKAQAETHFTQAARHFHTYYGQLARLALGSKAGPIRFREPARPTADDMKRFTARGIVRAIPISRQAGFDAFISLFTYQMARKLDSPGEMTLAAEFARRAAPPNVVVRFGKIALNRDFPVERYAYPTEMPEFEMLSGAAPVERALMMALARQESEFNPAARSSAGARGLMQLMPGTARMVARINGLRYRLSSLNEPEYNAKLGSFYMRRLLDRFDQSYIMMLAGYNAGPGRVNQWIKQFGDPRRPEIDPVDWVERIPFTQTRVYVHKIMESLQVYRALLNENAPGGMTLATDLHRGRRQAAPAPIYAGTAIN